ncbi:DUF3626 domain-containing protein [Nocardia sp. R6R-6]|uniref:DUF3626 domain-containing protein n=1 Tax=Nocardia sp. R6R-6 TaxID=3459303 RepID=UPI00403E1E7C
MVPSPQQRALRHVAALSSGGPLDPRLRLTANFHPDRMIEGRPILRRMAEVGVYQSQFVTGTSNGGLTAHPGGDRWRWESRIFAGAYDHVTAAERPVYGALNFRNDPAGGAPRFGSSYFRLTADTLSRATFCYPDSSTEPTNFGVAEYFSLIELAEFDDLDALDRDIEALVLDPSYRGTDVHGSALQLPCPIDWHRGFRLSVVGPSLFRCFLARQVTAIRGTPAQPAPTKLSRAPEQPGHDSPEATGRTPAMVRARGRSGDAPYHRPDLDTLGRSGRNPRRGNAAAGTASGSSWGPEFPSEPGPQLSPEAIGPR